MQKMRRPGLYEADRVKTKIKTSPVLAFHTAGDKYLSFQCQTPKQWRKFIAYHTVREATLKVEFTCGKE